MARARAFTAGQRAYLCSLDAVDRVDGSSRIYYADWFRVECMRRYRMGEKPSALFREAGLDPKLVGHKRIERAFARWRYLDHAPTQTHTHTTMPITAANPASNPASGSERVSAPSPASELASVSAPGVEPDREPGSVSVSGSNPAPTADSTLESPLAPEPNLKPATNPASQSRPEPDPNPNPASDPVPLPRHVVPSPDSRDRLIAAQALRIQQLEEEMHTLEHA